MFERRWISAWTASDLILFVGVDRYSKVDPPPFDECIDAESFISAAALLFGYAY